MLLQLIYFIIHLVFVLHLVFGYLLSSCFTNSIRSEISLHSLTMHWTHLPSLLALYSLSRILDLQPSKFSVGHLPVSSVGPEKIILFLLIIEKNLKTISSISLRTKQTATPSSFGELRDDQSSLYIGVYSSTMLQKYSLGIPFVHQVHVIGLQPNRHPVCYRGNALYMPVHEHCVKEDEV